MGQEVLDRTEAEQVQYDQLCQVAQEDGVGGPRWWRTPPPFPPFHTSLLDHWRLMRRTSIAKKHSPPARPNHFTCPHDSTPLQLLLYDILYVHPPTYCRSGILNHFLYFRPPWEPYRYTSLPNYTKKSTYILCICSYCTEIVHRTPALTSTAAL